MTTTLPNLPSQLIRLALNDLTIVEANPDYKIDMGTWHERSWNDRKICSVCFAGAVMANTLNVPVDESTFPREFESNICGKLQALDEFRMGNVDEGLNQMLLDVPEDCPISFDVCHYSIDPDKFKNQMKNLAKLLESHGL